MSTTSIILNIVALILIVIALYHIDYENLISKQNVSPYMIILSMSLLILSSFL